MSVAIIDIQGCMALNNEFIPKEIAVFYSSNHIQHMFSNTTSQQWVYNNYHELTWDGAYLLQHTAFNMLRCNLKRVNKIYVKGLEKRNWIMELLLNGSDGDCADKVVNLKENYPSIRELKKQYPGELRCNNHNGACALQNVQLIKKIFSF